MPVPSSEHGAALVEQTHDHRLTELHRHGGNPHIEVAVLHANVETAVLRQALFRDIRAGHDLQAHDQRRSHAVLLHHLFVEHTVDTLANPHHAVVRFDVNVGGLHLHGVLESVCSRRTTGASLLLSPRRERSKSLSCSSPSSSPASEAISLVRR